MLRREFLVLCAAVATAPSAAADEGSAALWRRLQGGGHVILMRHAATVPGTGDPAGFKMGQCATQRNLSPRGRLDAAGIGTAFRRQNVPIDAVLSSRWCRCLETAHLAFGRADAAPMLDSLFTEDAAAIERKLEQTRAYVGEYSKAGNLVFVTHDVNIRALVGRYLNQGSMVVAIAQPDGSLSVAGVLAVGDMR